MSNSLAVLQAKLAATQTPPPAPELTHNNGPIIKDPEAAVEEVQHPEQQSNLRAFHNPSFGERVNMLTARGTAFSFYRGHLVTDNEEIIAEALSLPHVTEVPYSSDIELPPTGSFKAPKSSFAEGWNQTTISPVELMARAVANSGDTPQAANSTSLASS